jgi:predicted dehydrogenase
MAETLRWGILGTGAIARKFAEGLASADGAQLTAVGSRSQDSAEDFAGRFSVPHRHGSYAALAGDEAVDVIYVATPHCAHKDNTLLCLSAGKAVLCEKPFAINAAEAREMIGAARREGLLLMEAMWTRFLPAMVRLRELLAAGAIGEVRMVQADFGFRTAWRPEGRLLNPHLGGGALLDVGVYTVSLASMILGPPARIAGVAHLGETGVDEQAGIVLLHDGGQIAVLSTAVRTSTPREATILGTEGYIRIHSPWFRPGRMTLSTGRRKDKLLKLPFKGNGYSYEAEEVMNCLRAGRTESDLMGLDETLSIMETMDEIRAQWGLKYPMEA